LRPNTSVRLSFVLVVAAALSGCFTAGVYRTARTLEEGEGDLGFNFAVTRISQTTTSDGTEGDEQSVTLPTIVPEINYHLGITDDFEFGGRVAPSSLFVELDGKYRVVGAKDERLHVAVAGHVGYQSAFFIDGLMLLLPVIVTYDVSDHIAVNVAAFGRMGFFSETLDDNEIDVGFTGTATAFGGHIGLELRGETFYIMPAFEVSRWMFETEGSSGDETVTGDVDTTILQGIVNFGFVFGREKKQLDRVERKLDTMDQKLDERAR
jgi:hypothetical protein